MKKLVSALLVMLLSLSLCSCGKCEHNYTEIVIKEATCAENGEKKVTCDICGETHNETIPKNDNHKFQETIIKNATCTESGVKELSCSVCGSSHDDTIKPLGHSYIDSTKKATCTNKGEKVSVCKTCGHTIKNEIAPLGHKWENATCDKPKTCTQCGATEGNALGHNKDSNGKCLRCGKVITIDMKTRIGAPTEEFAILRGKNSAGLIKLEWTAINNSGKTIKYYSATLYYYNAVDDPARNDITGDTYYKVKVVGPVAPGETLIIGDAGYCSICRSVVIGEVTLEYMDGTSDTGWYGYRFYL